MFSLAKYRAKRKNLPFNITPDDITIPTHCPVLGMPLKPGGGDSAPTLDRVVPGLGYTRGNVLVVSNLANRIKTNAAIGDIAKVALFYADHLNPET